jgi:hypothetical protein
MKRSRWVWLVLACFPLAALVVLLVVLGRRVPARSGVRPPPPAPPPADLTPYPPIPPPPEPPGPAPLLEPASPQPPPGPLLGPPPLPRQPEPERIPHFIAEVADATAQIVRGTGEVAFVIGFYADGTIRFADVDGGRYAGKAESARARMREVEGMRAFTVQIGVGEDGGLQATFTGGIHDGETLALVPLVGWSVA